jgi:hypothetical protein
VPRLPVGTLGPVIEVDTERPADVASIAEHPNPNPAIRLRTNNFRNVLSSNPCPA